MRELRKWVWAVTVATAAAAPVAAQSGTSSSTFSGSTGSAGATGTGGTSSGLGGSSGGGGSGLGGSSSGNTGSALTGSALQSMSSAPSLTAPTGTASNSLSSSNFLSGYYANPYYQGLINAQTNATPGGFGSALYGTSTTSGTGGVNRGTGSSGGLGGQNSNQQSGILIPLPAQMNYSAQMRFATPPMASTRMRADLRVVIDSTAQLSNPKGVQVITDDNNNVTLRGAVKDEEEARLVEGLIRLTPGVGAINNELSATATASVGR